jgi:hypothetical protein
MIEVRGLQQAQAGVHGAGLGVGRTVDQPPDPRGRDRSRSGGSSAGVQQPRVAPESRRAR